MERERDCSSRSLAECASGDLVEVRVVIRELAGAGAWHLNIGVGDVLQCVENGGGRVTVARPDGSRLRVPAGYAHLIGVRDLPDLFDGVPEG